MTLKSSPGAPSVSVSSGLNFLRIKRAAQSKSGVAYKSIPGQDSLAVDRCSTRRVPGVHTVRKACRIGSLLTFFCSLLFAPLPYSSRLFPLFERLEPATRNLPLVCVVTLVGYDSLTKLSLSHLTAKTLIGSPRFLFASAHSFIKSD